MKRVTYDREDEVIEFVRNRMKYNPEWVNARAIGLERNGEIIAGTVYEDFTDRDVCMHVAADARMTPEFIIACFVYPFDTCGLSRVTGLVPAKNEKALRFDIHLGFQVEGRLRRALPDDDIIVLGMLREECRFIGGARHG